MGKGGGGGESTIAVPDDRRKQPGAFLRVRRESLDPQR
ncbi:hypothetical protein ACQJ14_26630, partial [Klebsiella pneumoniae]